MTGSFRSFDKQTQEILGKRIHETLKESEMRGFKFDIKTGGYPAIENSKYGCDKIISAAEQVIDAAGINTGCEPMAASEDFSYFTQDVEGAFFFLGSGNSEKGLNTPLHSNPFKADEDCISIGAAIFASIVM